MTYNPRRNRLDIMHPAEKYIQDAIWEIEKLDANPELTNAQILLQQAKDKVSDFLDAKEKPMALHPVHQQAWDEQVKENWEKVKENYVESFVQGERQRQAAYHFDNVSEALFGKGLPVSPTSIVMNEEKTIEQQAEELVKKIFYSPATNGKAFNSIQEGVTAVLEFAKKVADRKHLPAQPGEGIRPLLELLAAHGGTIVSTASMHPEWIDQARASGRMYVDDNSLGYVWEPDIKDFPETPEEVEWFEKWYPLKVSLPEHLKNHFFLFKNKSEL